MATSVSIIVLPTAWMRCSPMPSRSRFTRASGEWMKRRLESASVRMRLSSLGHRAVPGAKARLEVADRDLELRRHQSGGEGGVHVAGHEHPVRPDAADDRLDRLHHPGRLRRVGARADAEHEVGASDPELLEEDARMASS